MRRLLRALNETVAVRVTLMVATMECVYAFLLLSLLPLFAPRIETVIQYLSSSILQLVLLPMIMVGQGILSRNAEAERKQDHEAIMREMDELRAIRRMLEQMSVQP